DHYHAVGAAGAVDGGGRCVFEDFHGFDIGILQESWITVVREPVDHIQRFVAAQDGVGAADTNGNAAAGGTSVLYHPHPCRAAVKRLHDVGGRECVDFLGFHLAEGTCQI